MESRNGTTVYLVTKIEIENEERLRQATRRYLESEYGERNEDPSWSDVLEYLAVGTRRRTETAGYRVRAFNELRE